MKAFVMLTAAILLLCGCSTDSEAVPHQSANAHTPIEFSDAQRAKFDRSCGVCHGIPSTGAPAPRDAEAWASRNTQGMATLIDHTINGYRGMPPMGMCMDCDQADFAVFVEYLSGLECEE